MSGNSNRRVTEAIKRYGPFALLLGFTLLYGYLMRPNIAGLWHDDGVYLLGSKALATGHGYRLLSEPGFPAIVKYPPLLSLLLAPLWWLGAGASGNWLWFKAFNILVGVGALGMLYHFARRYAGLGMGSAGLLLLLVGLNPVWLSLVSDVMSEPLYLLLTLCLLLLSTRIHQRGTSPTNREKLAGVLLSVAVFYTRTIGITAIVGLALWLWKRFNARLGSAYLCLCGVLCAPWLIWTALQPSGIYAIGHVEIASYNLTYFRELSLEIVKANGLGTLLGNTLQQFPISLLGAFLPGISEQMPLQIIRGILALLLVIGLGRYGMLLLRPVTAPRHIPTSAYVFFYLIACLFWYAHEQYARLMLPILPFLWIAILQWWNARMTLRLSQPIPRFAVQTICAIGLLLASVQPWTISQLARGNAMASNAGPELWQDYQATFAAIQRSSKPQDVFWARNNSLYPLYTNRFVVSRNLFPTAQAYQTGELWGDSQSLPRLFSRIFTHEKITYLILDPRIQGQTLLNPTHGPLLDTILTLPEHFRPAYRSPHGYITVYRYTP